MAITTYAELQSSIGSWLHRSDLAAQIPDFIALAESRLSADLDARPMESRATLVCTAGNAYAALPADLLELRRLSVLTDPVRLLQYATPDQIAADFPTALSGCPMVFAVIGQEMQLAPLPDSDYTLELSYRQRIPALSDANPANWLLTGFPAAYLYGALCAAQPFVMDDERAATFERLYAQAVSSINSIDWYSGTTMRVRAR